VRAARADLPFDLVRNTSALHDDVYLLGYVLVRMLSHRHLER
jgi:hypothetical protein